VLDSQLVRETHFKYPNNFHNYFSNEILENWKLTIIGSDKCFAARE
jgi:hypothetical protein